MFPQNSLRHVLLKNTPTWEQKGEQFSLGGPEKLFSKNKQQTGGWNFAAAHAETVRAGVPLLMQHCTASALELCCYGYNDFRIQSLSAPAESIAIASLLCVENH